MMFIYKRNNININYTKQERYRKETMIKDCKDAGIPVVIQNRPYNPGNNRIGSSKSVEDLFPFVPEK